MKHFPHKKTHRISGMRPSGWQIRSRNQIRLNHHVSSPKGISQSFIDIYRSTRFEKYFKWERVHPVCPTISKYVGTRGDLPREIFVFDRHTRSSHTIHAPGIHWLCRQVSRPKHWDVLSAAQGFRHGASHPGELPPLFFCESTQTCLYCSVKYLILVPNSVVFLNEIICIGFNFHCLYVVDVYNVPVFPFE